MATRTPDGTPGDYYTRALNNETDLYVSRSGPRAKYGGRFPLFYLETDPGEALEHQQVESGKERTASYDPLAPELLSYEELAAAILSHQHAVQEDKRQRTEEFEKLAGLSLPEVA